MRQRCARVGVYLLSVVWGLVGLAAPALAIPITYTGSDDDLQASASFDVVGTNLVVTLTNTSPLDVLRPADLLTAVFFDVTGPSLTLTPVSAVLGPGSTVLFGVTEPGGVVGGEWAYRGSLPQAPDDARYGISSSGLDLFGPHDRFPGGNLEGPASPGGMEYGITSAGDDPATGNAPVTGKNALIKNQVIFTLSGLPDGFDPSSRITSVFWQYGTAMNEPGFPVPEPTSLLLLALGGLAMIRRRR